MVETLKNLDDLVALCKRRGFIFQSSDIYGGLASCYDYGPLGAELKRNVKNAWWKANVQMRDDMVGIDCSILMHPMVWKASGHVEKFADLVAECKKCHTRSRVDHLVSVDTSRGKHSTGSDSRGLNDTNSSDSSSSTPIVSPAGNINQPPLPLSDKLCPKCQAVGHFTNPMPFKLMFETQMGANVDDAVSLYLRPETAQGIFINFANVLNTTRQKVPFGIAQIGKSFRNEVTTKAFIFRTREFEQMEIEFFCKPGTDDQWFEHWKEQRKNWYLNLGIRPENLRLREHASDELAHYAKGCVDVEYRFPFSQGDWQELEGIANRADFDLRQHQRGMRSLTSWFENKRDTEKTTLAAEDAEWSKGPLSYFDEDEKARYIPYVIEPSAGVDRGALAFLVDAYAEEEVRGEKRSLLRLHPALAPIKIGVFPLVKRDGMAEKAHAIYEDLRRYYHCFYDEKSAVGRRYRRQDEAGTPFCVTVDGQTNLDQTVTVRHRDSMAQVRVSTDKILDYMRANLNL